MSDIQFVDGLFFKEPRAQAPDYVKGSISIQPAKLAAWLQQFQGQEWVNVDVKESRGGKIYCAVSDWAPNGKSGKAQGHTPQESRKKSAPSGSFTDDEIPFAALGKRAHWIA